MFDAEWPDATTEVTAWLTADLSIPVRWTVPNPRPDQFVVVRRTGDADSPTWAERASLAVDCWSGEPNSNPKPAHLLASAVKRSLLAMPAGNNPIGDVTVTGRAYAPDPASLVPRVTLGVAVLIRPYAAS